MNKANAQLAGLLARIDPALNPKLHNFSTPFITFRGCRDGEPYRYGKIVLSTKGLALTVRGVDPAAVLSCLNAPEIPK